MKKEGDKSLNKFSLNEFNFSLWWVVFISQQRQEPDKTDR
ncbi:hypothetical protein HMPREF0208_00546 [Citrobacter koseri]|nr:hypothetical protein HMPREF3207_04420 [Citrobacter koseri]KXA01790.1 hypothetical protein HMPREF3220_01359 [Citrobacter koseri]KXB46660.1 hypothetical protein HMPREF0208_00546 [Citrobacter koseri]